MQICMYIIIKFHKYVYSYNFCTKLLIIYNYFFIICADTMFTHQHLILDKAILEYFP